MNESVQRWNFVRSETYEILQSLTDQQLLFKPDGKTWQPLYFQFGCIGRTQLVYAIAAETGIMDFSLFGSSDMPGKLDYRTQAGLLEFLKQSNQKWLDAVASNRSGVRWPDGRKSIELHTACLAEHERLHHGQLISYFTMAGFELPAGFKRNWAL